jgi:hypothetical protein
VKYSQIQRQMLLDFPHTRQIRGVRKQRVAYRGQSFSLEGGKVLEVVLALQQHHTSVQHLLCKCKALSSNPVPPERKKKKKTKQLCT